MAQDGPSMDSDASLYVASQACEFSKCSWYNPSMSCKLTYAPPVGDRSSICFHNLCWIFHVEQRVTEYLALANRQEDLRVEPLMAAQYFVMIWVIGHSQIEHEDGLILVDPKKIRNALEDTEESIFVHRLEVAALSSQIEHVPSNGAWQDFVVLQDVVQNIVQVASSARDHPEF